MTVFLDLSKAFDRVDHNILLYKLVHYGFRAMVLDWFRNYLSGRKQIVKFKLTSSDYLTIKCGVPQGSLLEPLLFLIYVNDIHKSAEILSFILFADDKKSVLKSPRFKNYQQYHKSRILLEMVTLWLAANKLSLKVGKTNFYDLQKQK